MKRKLEKLSLKNITLKIAQYLLITSSRQHPSPKLLHPHPNPLYPTITKISPAVEVE